VEQKILISGAGGFIGRAASERFSAEGWKVSALSRSQGAGVFWDVERGMLNPSELEGFDAVLHLAGENIFGMWTAAKKRKIRESRVLGTRLLCERLAQTKNPPKVFICTSAVGYYGVEPQNPCYEDSPMGDDFLARVCGEWEAAAEPLKAAGTRIAALRFGAVLSPRGGMVGKLAPWFKRGLGAVVGEPDKNFSWIAIDDLCAAAVFCAQTPSLSGPINAVAPDCASNADFTRALGEFFGVRVRLRIPEFLIRIFGGEMGRALLLPDRFVVPKKLLASSFKFRAERIKDALK